MTEAGPGSIHNIDVRPRDQTAVDAGGRGLSLVEFDDNFEWPSRCFGLSLKRTNGTQLPGENRAVKDVAWREPDRVPGGNRTSSKLPNQCLGSS
jgi:hypothetical protein